MDLPECEQIIYISVCISMIICFEIGVFCKISDGLVAMELKNINILSFLFMAFVNQTWVT